MEAREEFQSKYQNYFRKEAEKTPMFRQMYLEKPTKWFLNLSSDKKQMDSPSNKLEQNKDIHGFYENILKKIDETKWENNRGRD